MTAPTSPAAAPPSAAAKAAAKRRAILNARSCRLAACRDCHGVVLAGLDDDRAATRVLAETTPVTYLEAVVALLSGRGVLGRQRVHSGMGLLWRLDDLALANGGPHLPLHLEHACPRPAARPAAQPLDPRRTP